MLAGAGSCTGRGAVRRQGRGTPETRSAEQQCRQEERGSALRSDSVVGTSRMAASAVSAAQPSFWGGGGGSAGKKTAATHLGGASLQCRPGG